MAGDSMDVKFVVVGGGIAGVTCAEALAALCPDDNILLVTASKLIKAVVNYQKLSRALETFDVEERHMSTVQSECPNVNVVQKTVESLNPDTHVLTTVDGCTIHYGQLCICTGGKPKLIAKDNQYILGIRDTESVQEFQKRLRLARRVIVIGNGGIATELVYEIEGCEVIWAIKDKSISSTFVDPGAATFFLPQLNETKTQSQSPSKRHKYTEEDTSVCQQASPTTFRGGALGPDWSAHIDMKGSISESHQVNVEYEVEVERIWSPDELIAAGKLEFLRSELDTLKENLDHWPVYVELTNKKVIGCDFIVSATGVTPNTDPFNTDGKFSIANDGGMIVNDKMQTNVADVFAAGDICSIGWKPAPHWIQMRLWTQARQMGSYAAKCMVAATKNEHIHMDFCFELFAHSTKFFNYKVILLGKFNAQGFGADHELLLRVTKGEEFVKVVVHDGRVQGAVLIGETDLEEMFENLILNQTDITPFKDHLLDPNIDIEDFFD